MIKSFDFFEILYYHYILAKMYIFFEILLFFTRCVFHLLGKKVVAFDVRLTHHVNNIASRGRVVFGTVDLNEGHGYDPSTGIFTAPAAGVYVFDWTIMTQQGKYAHTSLVVNGNLKSWSHCHDYVKTYLSCSKMTVVKLKQGDKVWIGVWLGPADIYKTYTSYSGYKQ